MSKPNTLDEQIRVILVDYNGYDFCGEKACNGYGKATELIDQLKTLFTEHSKEVDRLARIDELDRCYQKFGMPKQLRTNLFTDFTHYQIDRIAQLKSNKREQA